MQPRLSSTVKPMHHTSDDDDGVLNNDHSSNDKAVLNLSVWERWYVAKLKLEKEKSILKVRIFCAMLKASFNSQFV